jgi:hypothetical protein
MGTGLNRAAQGIEKFMQAQLPDAVVRAASGRKSTPLRPVRNVDYGKMPAEEVRDMLATEKGKAKLRTLTPEQKKVIRSKLYDQNELWGQQFDAEVYGRVAGKERSGDGGTKDAAKSRAAGYDPAKDAPRKTDGSAKAPPKVPEHDVLDRAEGSVGKKLNREATRSESADVRETGDALDSVRTGRKQAQRPLGTYLDQRRTRTPEKPGDAELDDIVEFRLGTPTQRGAQWGKQPPGSEVIAGGGDGTTGLPVSQKLPNDLGAREPRQRIRREDEVDPNEITRETRASRPTTRINGIEEKLKGVENRARDERTTAIGNTQSSSYLNAATADVVRQLVGKPAPADLVYATKVDGVETTRRLKAGEPMDAGAARQALREGLLRDFVGRGLSNQKWADEAADATRDTATNRVTKRPAANGNLAVRPEYRESTNAQRREGISADELARRDTIAATGFNPNAAETGMRISDEELAGRIDFGGQRDPLGGRLTQDPTDRFSAAQEQVFNRYREEGHKFLGTVSGAQSDHEAYANAYKLAEALVLSDLPGTRISQVAEREAIHGLAESLVRGYGFEKPNSMPRFIEAADRAALKADIESGHTSVLGTKPPVEPGPASGARWSEAENRWVQSPQPLPGFLADRARSRPFTPDVGSPPKAGAPQGPVEFPLQEPTPGVASTAPEYRSGVGGKTVDELIADYEAGRLTDEKQIEDVLEIIRGREARGTGTLVDARPERQRVTGERNDSLLRHKDPIAPVSTADEGAELDDPFTGSEDAKPVWAAKGGGRGKKPPTTTTSAAGDDGLDPVPDQSVLDGGVTPSSQTRTPAPASSLPVERFRGDYRDAGTDNWASIPGEGGATDVTMPNTLVIDTPRPLDIDSANTLRGKPSPDEVANKRAARRERNAADIVTDPAPMDVSAAPAPARPPKGQQAPPPNQPPPQVGDGVGAAAARARARAAGAQSGWGSTFDPPPFSPDPPRAPQPTAPEAPSGDVDFDPFLDAIDPQQAAAPVTPAQQAAMHPDPLPGITESDFVTDPFDPRFRPRNTPRQPQPPATVPAAADGIEQNIRRLAGRGVDFVRQRPIVSTSIGGAAAALWLANRPEPKDPFDNIPGSSGPSGFGPVDAGPADIPAGPPAVSADVGAEAAAIRAIREARLARARASLRENNIGRPDTMWHD